MVEEKIKNQFNLRSKEFNISANWVRDKRLVEMHLELAGEPSGRALDLCCGTGQIGRALKTKGWKVEGLDISENMLEISSNYFGVLQTKADALPFKSDCFKLVVCRQSFQFLEAIKVLSEVKRVLSPGGIFILSLTVPFSDMDQEWLYEIHRLKQPLLLRFYTAEGLIEELKQAGFLIKKIKTLKVRESITIWMNYAPELTQEVRQRVSSMIQNAPFAYKKLHSVEVVDGEIFEDWNWVVIKATL